MWNAAHAGLAGATASPEQALWDVCELVEGEEEWLRDMSERGHMNWEW